MSNDNDVCVLCGSSPEEGMHMSGTKFIKGEAMTYQLCYECCMTKDEDYNEGVPSRKKLWNQVEKKLLELKRQSK